MSDPIKQRADGCSVFFSLILGVVFVSAYFIFENFAQDDTKTRADSMISNERSEKVSKYNLESDLYMKKIDDYHKDNNSSLESVMKKTTDLYTSNKLNSN
tara:strand:- start:136 stop:435 length:300 start_codon:yes stop_codon:yes gene_type:complete